MGRTGAHCFCVLSCGGGLVSTVGAISARQCNRHRGGSHLFKEALENIVERKMTMELSMTIALLSALAIGEFFTALVITGFVLAAEVLEGLTVGRGRRAIQDLLDFLPKAVFVRRNNEVIEIPAGNLRLSDTVIV